MTDTEKLAIVLEAIKKDNSKINPQKLEELGPYLALLNKFIENSR